MNDLFRPWAWKWGSLGNYFLLLLLFLLVVVVVVVVLVVRFGLWPLFIFSRELPRRPRTTRKGTRARVLLEVDHKGKREQNGHKVSRQIGHKCAENELLAPRN